MRKKLQTLREGAGYTPVSYTHLVRQETALGVLHALNVRDQAQGGAVAHAAHHGIQADGLELWHERDVYKRQVFFDPVNSLVSGSMTEQQWIDGIKSASDQMRANIID